MKGFFDSVAKAIARIYNSFHPKLKIAVMVFSSMLASGFINLVIRDITDYSANLSSDYAKTFFDALIPLLTVIVNLIQQVVVESGTKSLASEGDPKTIEKLDEKIADTKEIKNLSK